MPAYKKFPGSVFLFDVNSSGEYKESAIDCYGKISKLKQLKRDGSVTKLMVIEQNGKRDLTDYGKYDVNHTDLLKACKSNVENLDWLSSLKEAVDDLYILFEKYHHCMYQIVVLSDLKTPLTLTKSEIDETVEHIINSLYDYSGYIYFLGINIEPEKMLKTKIDVFNWAQALNADDNLNYKIASKIIKGSMGVMCDFDIGVDLFMSYRESGIGFHFTVPLSFNDLHLPTRARKFLCKSTSYVPVPDQTFISECYVLAEDNLIEVPRDKTTRAKVFSEKLIRIPQDVAKGVKEYQRFFKIIGFTDSKNVPSHYISNEHIDLVFNNKNTSPKFTFNYLIAAAEKYNKYGIAVRAYLKNSPPKLYCLIPKNHPRRFLMAELAYAEDFVLPYRESDIAKTENLNSDICNYLNNLSLDKKLVIHPNLRQSDTRKRVAEIAADVWTDRVQQRNLIPFNIKFEDTHLPKVESVTNKEFSLW